MESVFPRLHPNFVTVCVSYSGLMAHFSDEQTKGCGLVYRLLGKAFTCGDLRPWVVLTLIKTCNCSQSLREENKCAFHFGMIVL